MKNKSLFNKISLLISIVILFLILILSVLGSFNRVGYLSEFKLISSNNNIYSYNFRIKYYSKVFRNSDIYGVYFDTNKVIKENNYIIKITIDTSGSPFGILESNKNIDSDIDNIIYTLKLKKSIIILSLLLVIILLLNSIIIDFIKKFSKFNFRNRYVYILLIFLCFLIMPNIIYKIFYNKFDHTNYENRVFASKPKFEFNKIQNYPKLYETYFNDYIPFRNELVQIKNLIDIFIFNNIINNRVLLGKDNWLFFKDGNLMEKYIGLDSEYFTDEELIVAKNNLLHFRDELKKRNIDFIFMVCSDKQFIYHEYMPEYVKRKRNISPADEFIMYITNNTDLEIIYTKDSLLKYKKDHQLYYKYDTHWNYSGAYVGYTEINKKLKLSITNMYDRSEELLPLNPYNDMAKILSLSKYKYFTNDASYIILYYTKGLFDFIDFIDWSHIYTSQAKNVLYDAYAFVIRDSYTDAMLPFISSTIRNVTYYNYYQFKNYEITNRNPNIVIVETIERELKNRVLVEIPNYKIEEINR